MTLASGFSLFVLLTAMVVPTAAEENHINWEFPNGESHFETAFHQTWRLSSGSRIEKFQFSAIRFHLGYFQLKLIGVGDFAKRHPRQIAEPQKVDPGLDSLLELGLEAILRARPFEDIVALIAGGFPASEKKPIPLGLLRTSGITQSQLLDDGPTAVLCLDSPKFQGQGYQFQLPVFYKADDDRQQGFVRQCSDAVQVGPRIIEDRDSVSKDSAVQVSYQSLLKGVPKIWPVYLGISSKSSVTRAAYYRTVLALDEPGRIDSKDGTGKSRELARNAYVIVTETPVTLWEIQSMLVSAGFYANSQYAPDWALNLVGGDFAGMMVDLAGKDSVRAVGNVNITQASVLAVVRKRGF